MNIALIRRRFSPVGGAELYLQRLLGALVGAGHEVHLYAQSWSGQAVGVGAHPVRVAAPRAGAPLAFALEVQRMLRGANHDLVFSLERTLHQDVYRAGDGVHASWIEAKRRYAPWWRRWWEGRSAFHRGLCALEARSLCASNTGEVIVNSNLVGEDIATRFAFPAERIHLVRNGIDLSRHGHADRQQARAQWGLADDDFVMLFAGSGWERKGLHFALQAMRQLTPNDPKLKLLVAGRGRCLRPGKQVRLLGPVSEMPSLYAAADAMLFPPIYEPCANVVSEALAAGLPVITTRSNGASELIEPGVHGEILSDPADIGAMVQSIQRWRQRPPTRVVTPAGVLSLQENAAQTLRVLELALERKREGLRR
jgi:UDP-glucose:(heptosyl)LPS alpha-1,3-glucosyltransferase